MGYAICSRKDGPLPLPALHLDECHNEPGGATMIVGVPAEGKNGESRVAITPAGVRELTSVGHTVLMQSGAGIGSSIRDDEFVATGASVLTDAIDVWSRADMVLKVKEPVADEYPLLRLKRDQVLFTYLHLAASRACTEALMASGTTAIAYETVRLPD